MLLREVCIIEKKMTNETIAEFLRPLHESKDKRKRYQKFFLAGDKCYTMEAAKKFKQLKVPTMILWAENDRYLPKSWGRKLYDEIKGAKRFHIIPHCGHFWQEEKAEEFSKYMLEFISSA